jgi:alkylhydroperoxidase family enzyme
VLAAYRTAPIPEKVRVTLAFLEKLTLRPAEVGPADVVPLRAAGLADDEIEDAI